MPGVDWGLKSPKGPTGSGPLPILHGRKQGAEKDRGQGEAPAAGPGGAPSTSGHVFLRPRSQDRHWHIVGAQETLSAYRWVRPRTQL